MANRYRNEQSGMQGRGDFSRGSGERWREDEGRYSSAGDERDYGPRDYGPYVDSAEGESSVRAGEYDRGRVQRNRDTSDQSGSTGRFAGYGDSAHGDYSGGRHGYTGQGRYGQNFWGQEHAGRGNFEGGNHGGATFGGGNYGAGQGTGRGFQGYGYEVGGSRPGQGLHRGKGPKGYQRSDERLKELICERLRDDPEIDPSEVTVTVQGGKVTLDGTVDSRQAKNAIEDVAEQFGVDDIQNNLRVQRGSAMHEGGPGAASGRSEQGRLQDKQDEGGSRPNRH